LILAALIVSAALSRTVPHFRPAVGYSAKVAAIGCLFWVLLSNLDSPVVRLLESRPLVWLGVLSYSLYLWQQLFLNYTRDEWIYRWPQNIVAALLAAVASYALVESKFLRFKNRAARSTG
jgi:peptidoglycan/LPS O-acetylase OafA/YrhL